MDLNLTGKTIAKLRKSAGLTQASLAEKLGVSDKAVSKWERGIACPDVSLWNKLSILLDTDIESLIYGHEIDNTWHGVLVLDDIIPTETTVYNKPLIHYLISQFLLVGITEIAIVGKCENLDIPGVQVFRYTDLSEVNQRFRNNVFIIWGNSFIYGPNVTKHFKRAMSRKNSTTIIASLKRQGTHPISFDQERKIKKYEQHTINQYYAEPFIFVSGPAENIYNYQLPQILINSNMYVETLVRGMAIFYLKNYNDIFEMSKYINTIENITGDKVACIPEILVRREICDIKMAKKFSDSETRKYLGTVFNS